MVDDYIIFLQNHLLLFIIHFYFSKLFCKNKNLFHFLKIIIDIASLNFVINSLIIISNTNKITFL